MRLFRSYDERGGKKKYVRIQVWAQERGREKKKTGLEKIHVTRDQRKERIGCGGDRNRLVVEEMGTV